MTGQMKVQLTLLSIVCVLLSWSHAAAADDAKARQQFENALAGVNQNSFEPIKSAIDKTALSERVMQVHMLDTAVKMAFDENFWDIVESIAMSSMPNAKQKSKGEIVKFTFSEGSGQAIVRFKMPGYAFAYQIWNLQEIRGRVRVVNWFTSNQGITIAEAIANELLIMKPNNGATRRLIGNTNPTNQQLFQVTEILKAARDRQVPRFFEIYDKLSEALRGDELLAKLALQMAYTTNDRGRFVQTFDVFVDVFGRDPDYGAGISDSQILMGRIDAGYQFLLKFHNSMQFEEGALPSRLSALALALGNTAAATEHAELATQNEPTLALAWWSLLRANVSAQDFEGAIVPLTRLEDDFGQHLDAAQLKRDPYNAFDELAESQVFLDWRADR